jgi:hypothetical protein
MPTPKRVEYDSIFISPHIDDVLFSSGGTLLQSRSRGTVLVVNVFSKSIRQTKLRKEEENFIAQRLGYESVFLDFPDLERRSPWARWPAAMYRTLGAGEAVWVAAIGEAVSTLLKPLTYRQCYFPLGVGSHLDHEICFWAGVEFFSKPSTFFYEDIPYALAPGNIEARLFHLTGGGPENFTEWEEGFCDHVASRPGLGSLGRYGLGAMVRKGALRFYRRRAEALKKSPRDRPTLSLRPHWIGIDETFPDKIRGMWGYRSQIQKYFFHPEDTEKLLYKFHSGRGGQAGKLQERFWKFEERTLKN